MNTNQNNEFNIQDTIELYGMKNIRIFMEGDRIDHTFATMTGLPMGFTSSNNTEPMVEFHITECNNHKIHFTPSNKYTIQYTQYGEVVAEANAFANTKNYLSDFEYMVKTGSAKVYLETDDGYHLIFGVFTDVISKTDIKTLEWSKNVLNVLQFNKDN